MVGVPDVMAMEEEEAKGGLVLTGPETSGRIVMRECVLYSTNIQYSVLHTQTESRARPSPWVVSPLTVAA